MNDKVVVDLVLELYILLISVFLFESIKEDMKKVVIDDWKVILISMKNIFGLKVLDNSVSFFD